MLNENAKKWVAALRSGEYKQTTEVLYNKTEDAYCCLGVACMVYEQETGNMLTKDLEVEQGFDESLRAFPEVQEWLGLNGEEGYFNQIERGKRYAKTLTTLNDSEGYSFEDIADVIESEPDGLFNT